MPILNNHFKMSTYKIDFISDGDSRSGTLWRTVPRGPRSPLRFGGDDMVRGRLLDNPQPDR